MVEKWAYIFLFVLCIFPLFCTSMRERGDDAALSWIQKLFFFF